MKKILYSASAIVAVAAMVLYSTGAFFSDTETSTGNVFTAGAIDLQIDSVQHYNGMVCVSNGEVYQWAPEEYVTLNDENQPEVTTPYDPVVWNTAHPASYPKAGAVCNGTWPLQDLSTADGDTHVVSKKFFNFNDIKPGDEGENTVSLHVINNDAWVCASVANLTNLENGQTEPEALDDNSTGTNEGELQNAMDWVVWRDDGAGTGGVAGDNIHQGGEQVLASGHPVNGVLALYDSQTSTGPLTATSTAYLGVSWSLPIGTGNAVQTDSMTGDISFEVVQSRNNPGFVCGQSQPEPRQLVLDNEIMVGDPWTTTPNDQIGGVLTWAGDGPTFNYSVTASGLPASTNYSLIYYADPYPGNFPGKLIGTGTTDGSGNLVFSGNPDLGMDLPMPADTNSGSPHFGAKIWLIPSANYNAGTNSVTPWTPDNTWLFEGNVYINYNDTNN